MAIKPSQVHLSTYTISRSAAKNMSWKPTEWILSLPRAIGGKLQGFLAYFMGYGFEITNDTLVRHRGHLWSEETKLCDLAKWHAAPEMCFDIVCLRLSNGTVLRWCDDTGKLAAMLRSALPQREVSDESEEA